MTEPDNSEDWALIRDVAPLVGRKVNQIYIWIRKDQSETHIRRRKIAGKTFVHIPSLLEYEATVTAGRPRES